MISDVSYVLAKLEWMRSERIWPNGLRYLWTDAFGLVLLVSLYGELRERLWLDEAEELVAHVDRVLGRARGIRLGEAPDRDGQYFHYLAMWLFALARLGDVKPEYRSRGVALARDVHAAFVIPDRGVIWKMKEDLSGPYPGFGFSSMDAYNGYVSYRILDENALAPEIADMRALIERDWRTLNIEQDLGLGMMLWLAHFCPHEPWARAQVQRALGTLDTMWIDPPGYFCRAPWLRRMKFAFTNFGVSLGLQAVGVWPERVERLNAFFDTWRSGNGYDREAITWVMACTSRFPGAFVQSGGNSDACSIMAES